MATPAEQRDVDGWREPAGRYNHSTAVVENQLYLWGGDQDRMPWVHDSAEKRQFYSNVEVFDVSTGCWEQRTTRGTPPLGVAGYSCVAVNNKLHYFGGWCGHGGGCYHNSVHTLSTSTLQWRMLAPSTTESGTPMQKKWCGMVHFTVGEEHLLYVVGGYGYPVPSSPQHGAEYHKYRDDWFTNEQHIFSLSSNGWSSPVVTGQAPSPCDEFTLITAGEKRAAVFGGSIQSTLYCDDFYIVDLRRHSVNWNRIKKPVSQWPEGRLGHAASHVTGPVFVMIGGYGGREYLLSDVWSCGSRNQWNKLATSGVPDSVTERYRHSVSVFHLGAHCVWILVFGGWLYKAATSIIVLIQDTSGQWCVERVMERETLSNNTEYQERLREARIKGVSKFQVQDIKQLHEQMQENKQQQTEEAVKQSLTHDQPVTNEVYELQQKINRAQATIRAKESEVHELQQQLVNKLKRELTKKEDEVQKLQQEIACEQQKVRDREEELQKSKEDLKYCQQKIKAHKDRPLLVQAETQTDQDLDRLDRLRKAPSTADLMVHVARKIPTKWYEVGIMLQIETSKLNKFEKEATDQVRLCIMVFDEWKKEQKVPITWQTIITALEALDEKELAQELKEWLK